MSDPNYKHPELPKCKDGTNAHDWCIKGCLHQCNICGWKVTEVTSIDDIDLRDVIQRLFSNPNNIDNEYTSGYWITVALIESCITKDQITGRDLEDQVKAVVRERLQP